MAWPRRKTEAQCESSCAWNKEEIDENVRLRSGVTEGMKSFPCEGSLIFEFERKNCNRSGVEVEDGRMVLS